MAENSNWEDVTSEWQNTVCTLFSLMFGKSQASIKDVLKACTLVLAIKI